MSYQPVWLLETYGKLVSTRIVLVKNVERSVI